MGQPRRRYPPEPDAVLSVKVRKRCLRAGAAGSSFRLGICVPVVVVTAQPCLLTCLQPKCEHYRNFQSIERARI